LLRLPNDVRTHLEGGGALLVPSHQRAHAARLAYAAGRLEAGARVWASPDVMTDAAWVRRECTQRAQESPAEWPRILTAVEEWLLWRQAAAEAARGYPLLDPGVLAQTLQRSSELAAEYSIATPPGPAASEAALLEKAQRSFAARCQAHGAASVSALAWRLRDAPPAQALLVRGFAALSPRLAALAPGRAESAAAPPAALSERGVCTADAGGQMEAIAEWCRARLSTRPDARLLVIFPGSAGSRERLAALILSALDAAALAAPHPTRACVGIEGGEPFGALPLPAHALQSLTLLGGAALDPQSVGRWLCAPYWGSGDDAARAALARLLRQRASASLDLRELLGALQLAPPELKPAARALDARLREAQQQLGEEPATPRRWSERFDAALAALSWPGPLPADSAPQQTRVRFSELLEEFGELAGSIATLRREPALELLRALALHTAYRPADEDLAVTLSPMLADPVVLYDGIWVASLSADVLPQPLAPDPFLPLHAQRQAGLPAASVSGRRAEAQGLLAAWRRSTPELVLSVPARDADLELLPSACLAGLALQAASPAAVWLPLRLHREGCTQALEDVRGRAFNPRRPLPSGSRALTLQNACAFRAYAELRLGATPAEEAEPGVPADQRGLLLHAALQLLWERLRDSRALGELDERALDALIGECVAQAARALQSELRGRRRGYRAPDGQFDLFSVLSPALERECRRAQGLIRRLCELERTRPPFTVQATEYLTELSLGGGRLRLRLDRVDAIAGGRAVLDYKSGRPVSADWYGERPTHPQLLAYLMALGGDVVALATVNLTAHKVCFSGVAASGELLPEVRAYAGASPDWSAQQRSWAELIGRLIGAFLAGDARVDPAPGACDYCHLTDLCRIGAHQSPEVPGHPEEADE
jgi:ATP-dependent helicase/nuclease subunit B